MCLTRFSFQVSPHSDGVLVLPGWSDYILLLPRHRIPPAQHPLHHEAQEQSKLNVKYTNTSSWGKCSVTPVVKWLSCLTFLMGQFPFVSRISKSKFCSFRISLYFLQQQEQQELFPLGHSCAVCGKVKCKRHRYVSTLVILRLTHNPQSLHVKGH